jgi:tetratricopeptide (TPR) repeat protein
MLQGGSLNMSGTLNLIDRLLAMARDLWLGHRDFEAKRHLTRLAALPDLPANIAGETQVLLAEICIRERRYRQARKHLSIALLYQPDNARYHHLMGKALERGRDPDLLRAEDHYRQSLELDGEQPGRLADLGRLLLRRKNIEEGLGTLCRAVELAPNDPAIVDRLVRGLVKVGRADEAESVLQAARFRNRSDHRFQQLWQNFRFRRLLARQRSARRAAGFCSGPVVVPLNPAQETREPESCRHGPEPLAGPHRWRHMPHCDASNG